MNKYCNNTWQWAIETLQSNKDNGLKEFEIEERKLRFGSNNIDTIKNKIISSSLKEVCRGYVLFNLILVIILFLNNYKVYGTTLFLLTVVNLIVKVYISYKKIKKSDYLKALNYVKVKVLRDGVEKLIMAKDLVNGDIVYFKKNTLISADLRIIEAINLKVSEKNLTGEEFLKEKFESKIDGSIRGIVDMKNILLRGSKIKDGEGVGVVVSTGKNTEFGKILSFQNTNKIRKKEYLKQAEKKLSLYQGILTLIAIVLYFIFNMKNKDISYMLMPIYTVYIVPIIFVLISYTTIIKKSKNLIDPSTLLNIQDVEILFIEDVGSFTKEEMEVEKLFTDFQLVDLDNANYNKDINMKRLIDILLICNNATYNVKDDDGKGSIVEVGYLRFAAKKGAYKSIVDNRNKRKMEIPMDSDKRITTILTKGRKGTRANCRGAVDEVLDKCKFIMINGVEKELTNEHRDNIKAMDYNFSIEGLLTEGVAYRSFSYEPSQGENVESNLVFVGVVASRNPLRADYVESVDFLRKNDIIPIVFTSLNKISATALGMKTDLIRNSNQVISGVEIDRLPKKELLEILGRVRVFSRVNAQVKRKIIYSFSKEKYKVLSVAENVSDIPNLCLSTVGVVTGQASENIKSFGDVFIEKNVLLNVFDIIKQGKIFKSSLENYFKVYSMISLIQMVLINITHLYYKQSFDFKSILITTIIIGIPMMILALNDEFEIIKFNEICVSIGVISGVVLFTSYLLESELFAINILAFSMLAWTIINGKGFKKRSKINLMIIVVMTIVVISGLVLTIISLGGISSLEIASLAIIAVIFVTIEWIVKKWILL